jgi:hypothetical protein
MGDTRRFNDDYGDGNKKGKKLKKNKRIVDKYRKVIHNIDSFDEDDNAFDEYLDYEYKQNKTKTR